MKFRYWLLIYTLAFMSGFVQFKPVPLYFITVAGCVIALTMLYHDIINESRNRQEAYKFLEDKGYHLTRVGILGWAFVPEGIDSIDSYLRYTADPSNNHSQRIYWGLDMVDNLGYAGIKYAFERGEDPYDES